ncbi:MAG: hypothetical protein AAGD11_06215 [Planctomycetota bacterium]
MADEQPIRIRTEDHSPTARIAARSHRTGVFWLIVGAMVIVGVAVAIFVLLRQDRGPTQNLTNPASDETRQKSQSVATLDKTLALELATAADDGKSQWVSPTAGAAIDCRYLLAGTQFVLHMRVAELLAHEEGEKIVAALGPTGERSTQLLADATGVELSDIQTLTLGIRQSRSGRLDYAMRLRLLAPTSEDSMPLGCFLPEGDGDRTLVWCTPSALAELKGQGGEPPMFARELKRVLDQTDDQRLATLAVAGKFLQISGTKFLKGSGNALHTAIVDFLGDDATASSLSAHWDANFFLELRSTVALSKRPHRFAALLTERLATAPDQIEDRLLASTTHPYGRKVLARFPSMLRKLDNYTRSSEAQKLSLLRCYLPVVAGHNLLMATELLLNSESFGSATAGDGVVARTAQPTSIEQRLAKTTSLVFPKETLERALEMLSEDLGVPVQIAGRDLQLEGITKNQSLALDLRERRADEVLLAILRRANPDRTASGPADDKQKLVYVVRAKADGQPGAIVVTTRAAASRRGEKLPAVFQAAPR